MLLLVKGEKVQPISIVKVVRMVGLSNSSHFI